MNLLRTDGVVPILLAAAWVAAVALVRPEIVSPGNLGNVAVSAMPLLALAVGQLVVLVVGGIDLSVSAVVGLASVAGGLAMTQANAIAGVAVMLGVGLAVGLLHGLAVAWVRMPAFLVTMATLIAGGGAAVWLTRSKPVTDLPDGFLTVAGGAWSGVFVAIAVCGLLHLLLARTVTGRQLYAVGMNPAASRVSGVPVAARVTLAYALSGLCAAVAAALYTARLEAGSATLVPREVLLDVLGAAVIGGASLRGGRGTVAGVAAGVAVISLIGNGLTLLDLDYWHVVMAKGGLIFVAALFDAVRARGAP